MNNVLTAIAAFMVLVLALLFTVPMMINWDNYRSDFEVHLSKIVGSKVELDGSLNLRLLPAPFVSAENLRIGESGVRGRPILEVKELTMWVAVPPLLKGIMEASKLTLDRPRLLLQFDKNGKPTFDTTTEKPVERNADRNRAEGTFSKEASISGFELRPNLISLKNVQIVEGDLILQSASGNADKPARRLRFDHINGVLSAMTLNGPFYFNGKYTGSADERFIRLAIGSETEKEKTRLFPIKAKITVPDTDSRVEFDGTFGEKAEKWFASGDIKAGFGYFRSGGDITASVRKTGVGKDKSGAQADGRDEALKLAEKTIENQKPKSSLAADDDFYITSHLELSGHDAQFSKILVRAGSLARPQTVRGQVDINWQDELSLKGEADGQVIDLNSILMRARYGSIVVDSQMNGKQNRERLTEVNPGAAVTQLNDILLQQARQFETINFTMNAKQIYLGKGDVRDFRLLLKGEKGIIRVEDMAGRLPGSSRLSVSGTFAQVQAQSDSEHDKRETSDNTAEFDGQIYLRGLQFKEFINWAVPDYTGDIGAGRGKFMLNGKLNSVGSSLVLSGLQVDMGRSSLRGGMSYKKAAREADPSEIKVILKAGLINVEELLGKPVGLLEFEEELSSFIREMNRPDTKLRSEQAELVMNTVFELQAQRLVFKDGVQRDVRLLWTKDKAGSRIKSVAGVSENGLKFLYENGKADPSGEDRFIIEAPDFVAVEDLLKLSGVEHTLQFEGDAIGRFFPLRLAVRRQDEDDATQYRFDGVMGGSDAAFSVFVPKVANGVDQGPMTVLGGMESQNGALLAAKLLPLGMDRQVQQQDLGPGKLTFTASGTADTGFSGQVNLENAVMSASYKGQFALKKQQLASDGVLQFSGTNAKDVLSLFGYGHLAAGSADPFKARGTISLTSNGFSLSNLQMAIGDNQVIGTGIFEEKNGEKQYRLAMATDRLDFGSLIGVLQEDGAKKSRTRDSESSKKFVWSSLPFQFRSENANRKTESGARGDKDGSSPLLGEFSIKSNELQLTEQLSLSDALVQWRVHKTHIEIIKLEGKSLGGMFSASGTLRQGTGGAGTYSLNGLASLKGGRLEEVGTAEEASLGSGDFSFELSLSGVGGNPRALISSLVGQGFVKISDGKIRQVSPSLLGQLAERYLRSETGDPSQLKSDLTNIISNAGPIDIQSTDLGLQLIDGTVKLRQDDLGVKPGVIGIRAELSLRDLNWAGNWQIQPAVKSSAGAVPAVNRRMEGDLTSIGDMVAALDVADFERYLTLKHKERELRNLEKIRLEDEARRLAEQRRQAEEELKRIEQEKARIKAEQEKIDKELGRTDLPLLLPE